MCNFPANTGYAWDFIESLYAGLADRLGTGYRTFVAYPRLEAPPRSLAGSRAVAVELDAGLESAASLAATAAFVREHNIEVIYLCDRPAWSPQYSRLRRAGVRRIVVHDHTSGERSEPRGVRRMLKRARQALPGMLADEVIAVSDYVAARKRLVDLLPAARVRRVWNSIEAMPGRPDAAQRVRAAFGVSPERPVIVCAARATPEKGVDTLLRAFDLLMTDLPAGQPKPVLLYMGDGPALGALRELRASLAARGDMILAGYVENAIELVAGADVCVVPSVWQEAFGLAALEPMACGVAVVASRVGGIPEVIVDGETGRLVAPGDSQELADALQALLGDAAERERLGRNGRARARAVFSRERQLQELEEIVTTDMQNGERAR